MVINGKRRRFSEAVDIEAVLANAKGQETEDENEETSDYEIVHPKRMNVSLRWISLTYAWSQFVTAIVGGFAVTPSSKFRYLEGSICMQSNFCPIISDPTFLYP